MTQFESIKGKVLTSSMIQNILKYYIINTDKNKRFFLSGAILAFMLGFFHMPLDECEELYRKLGTDVFSQNVIVGTVKMSWSHAFYDSQTWENILK